MSAALCLLSCSIAMSQQSKKSGVNLEPDYYNNYNAQLGVNNIGPASVYMNFSSSISLSLPTGALFAPEVKTLGDVTTQELNNAKTYGNVLIGGNEPDKNGVSPQQWINVWPQMAATNLRLGTPSWTNDGNLAEFMREANALKYSVGFITIHPYTDAGSPVNTAQAADALIAEVEKIHALYPSKKIWPTEFGLAPWGSPFTTADTVSFMQNALPRLEALPYVEHYLFWTLGYPYSQYVASTMADYTTGNLLAPGVEYAGVTAHANPVPIPDGTYYLVPQNATGSCLDATGEGTANGTATDIWQANGGANQQWTFTSLGGSQYEIQPAYDSGLCLDVSGGSSANGTAVDLWTPNGGSNQIWNASPVSGSVFTFSPQCAPGSALDVSARGTANGTAIDIWAGNSQSNQQWALVTPPATDSSIVGTLGAPPYYLSKVTVTLTPVAGSLALSSTYYTVDGGARQTYAKPFAVTGNGAHSINFWSTDASGDAGATGNQSFTIDTSVPMIANGNHTLTPQNATGSRLDASGWGTANGTAADIWAASGGSNQSWTFTYLGGGQYAIQPSYDAGSGGIELELSESNFTTVDLTSAGGLSGDWNQYWYATKVSGNIYKFAPYWPGGNCLEVAGSGTSNGTGIDISAATNGSNQQWAVN